MHVQLVSRKRQTSWAKLCTEPYWMSGRKSQILLAGKFASDHGSFRPIGPHQSQSVPKISPSRTRIVHCEKIVTFIQGGGTLSKKGLEDLSSGERRSVVEESSSVVLSLLKREGVGAHCQALSERVIV